MTNMETIWKTIGDKTVNHVKLCEKIGINSHLVFKTFPGSGKTTTIMKSIDELGYNWIYLAPFHDIIKENLEYSKLRNYSFLHLKGKDQDGVCLVPEYREYASMGLNITPFCESRCVLRNNGCPYYETKNEIESYPSPWAGVHSHVPTYLQSFLFTKQYKKKMMYHHYDVLIMDEFPFSTIYNQVVVNEKDIMELRNVLHYMKEESYEKDVILEFLEEFLLNKEKLNYNRLKNLIGNNRSLNYENFIKEYDTLLLDLMMEETIKKPPKNIIYSLSQIHKENPEINRLAWNIYKHPGDGWFRKGFYITTSNIHYFKTLPLTVIALDATADINAWNTLLNHNCDLLEIDIEYKNIYQLKTNARYPISTWIKFVNNRVILSNTGEKLCRLIKKICSDNKRDVLLCCSKRGKSVIEKYLRENYDRNNYQFAIFYNLRSRNEFYQDCDTCIITHEPNIPPLQSNILSNIFDWDDIMLKKLMTTSEIKQGIGRIRQNMYTTPDGEIRTKIEIIVFPGVPDERYVDAKILPEARLITYDNLYAKNYEKLGNVLERIIKEGKRFTQKELFSLFGNDISNNSIKSELKKLYNDNKISDYKRNIHWIYDEAKAREVSYKIKDL